MGRVPIIVQMGYRRYGGVKRVLTLALLLIVLTATTSIIVGTKPLSESGAATPFHFGVSFCGNTTEEAKRLIDRVKNYSNLFVLQSGPVSANESATTEISDYAIASGLDIIVYFGWFPPEHSWRMFWLEQAKIRYGAQLLGVYYYDEPGGIQLDYNWSRYFTRHKMRNSLAYQAHAPAIEAYLNGSSMHTNYDDAAAIYLNYIRRDPNMTALKARSITTFTSDYALHWFDYLGGYDVVLAQLGWNDTLVQSIALVRGAAWLQNKQWGVILTWKYDEPPYLDSGEEIYNQLHMAYEAGSNYAMVFNYPQIEGNAYGIFTDEHFEAFERFWKDIQSEKRTEPSKRKAEAVFVLPSNYGWGMRRSDDRIWYWGPDDKSQKIWETSRNLLSKYGLGLDIVFDDPAFPVKGEYGRIYYWDSVA